MSRTKGAKDKNPRKKKNEAQKKIASRKKVITKKPSNTKNKKTIIRAGVEKNKGKRIGFAIGVEKA